MPGRTKIRGGSCEANSQMGPREEVKIKYHDDSDYFWFEIKLSDGTYDPRSCFGKLPQGAELELRWDKEGSPHASDTPHGSEAILT